MQKSDFIFKKSTSFLLIYSLLFESLTPVLAMRLSTTSSTPSISIVEEDVSDSSLHIEKRLLSDRQRNDFREKIRISLDAIEDPWSDMLQNLRKAFQEGSEEIQDIIKEALPWRVVDHSSLHLWPPDLLRKKEDILLGLHLNKTEDSSVSAENTPSSDEEIKISIPSTNPTPFTRLDQIIDGLTNVLQNNGKASQLMNHKVEVGKNLKTVCEELQNKLIQYKEDLHNDNNIIREFWCFPVRLRTELSDGTFLISQRMAKRLLKKGSFDILDKRQENGGSSPVVHIEDIYAKQNNVRHNTRGPAMEWAMSSFHRLLFSGSQKIRGEENGIEEESDNNDKKNEKEEERDDNDTEETDPLAGQEYVVSAVMSLMNVPLDESPDTIARLRQEILSNQKDQHLSAKDTTHDVDIPLHENRRFYPTESHIFQVTPEVRGKTFAYFAKRAQIAHSKNYVDFQWNGIDLGIDLASAQRIILSSFLTCPADAKADNLIVTHLRNSQGKRYIVSIDNDWALSPVLASGECDYLEGTRQILWAIPQFMEVPLVNSVRRAFLKYKDNHEIFLQDWLDMLEGQQKQYEQSFDHCFVSQTLQPLFPVESLQGIRERFEKLRKCIRAREDDGTANTLTCHDLLIILSPSVADQYQQLRFQSNPLQAFEGFYENRRILYRNQFQMRELAEEIHSIRHASQAQEVKKSNGGQPPEVQSSLFRWCSFLPFHREPSEKTPFLHHTSLSIQEGYRSFQDLGNIKNLQVNPRVQNIHGWTDLHKAAFVKEDRKIDTHLREVCTLLTNGADIKEQTDRGMTALHLAVYARNRSMCRELMKRGASYDEITEDGTTVKELASQIGFTGLDDLIWEKRRKDCGIGTTVCSAIIASIIIPCAIVFWPRKKSAALPLRRCLAGMNLASLNGTNGFNLTDEVKGDLAGYSVRSL